MAGRKITQLPTLTTPAATDKLVIVDVSDTSESPQGTSKQIAVSNLGLTSIESSTLDVSIADGVATVDLPYKVYSALITQSGTDAPTVTVLQNTLGGTIVWERADVGDYTGTLVGAFPANKTFCINGGVSINGGQMYLSRTSNDLINMYSYLINFDDLAFPTSDNVIQGSSIEIRVYP
jgi:hypothetical protein